VISCTNNMIRYDFRRKTVYVARSPQVYGFLPGDPTGAHTYAHTRARARAHIHRAGTERTSFVRVSRQTSKTYAFRISLQQRSPRITKRIVSSFIVITTYHRYHRCHHYDCDYRYYYYNYYYWRAERGNNVSSSSIWSFSVCFQ